MVGWSGLFDGYLSGVDMTTDIFLFFVMHWVFIVWLIWLYDRSVEGLKEQNRRLAAENRKLSIFNRVMSKDHC